MLEVFADDADALALLTEVYQAPSVHDEFLRYLHRQGFDIPLSVLERDVTEAWVLHPELVHTFRGIYENETENWTVYEACEELVDLEDNFQLWRFRHLKTVQRIIGMKPGTGGSSGAGFLQKALELTFFPELFAVRTEVGR
jgi:tryptophan 2,3-dioxygenase